MKPIAFTNTAIHYAIDVLKLAHVNKPVGYRLSACRVGPEIVALGHGGLISDICEGLLRHRFMQTFKGRLTLVSLDDLPDIQSDTLRSAINLPSIDHLVVLPNADTLAEAVNNGVAAIVGASKSDKAAVRLN